MIVSAANDTQDTIYIGVQPRYFPYSHQNAGQMEGVLVTVMRSVCTIMNYTCIFSPIDFNDSLKALRYRALDAIIIAEHFVAESDAKGLFFSPPICKTKPVFIWGERIQPILDKNTFKGKQIGVLANSYLEFYLQNQLSLNVHIIPYELLENAAFDLLSKKIDVLFSSQSFFQRRAKSLFLEQGIQYNLPSTALPVIDYKQPKHSMVLAIRQGDVLLKNNIIEAIGSKDPVYCFTFLPEKFLEK